MSKKAISNQETMPKKELEHYFSAIQQQFSNIDKRFDNVDKRFDGIERTLQSILSIVQNYDQEHKEFKSTLWEHDRRLINLEKQIS